jgi:predicted DNA binding CopG/RHH family protein
MTEPISIRMPKILLDHYKEKAKKTGLPYQSIIKNILADDYYRELARFSEETP